jgi:hypothetical protein
MFMKLKILLHIINSFRTAFIKIKITNYFAILMMKTYRFRITEKKVLRIETESCIVFVKK